MRGRALAVFGWLAQISRACSAAIAREIGPEEIALTVGLTLVTVGLWTLLEHVGVPGPVALMAPGGVTVWHALPSRVPFIDRPEAPSAPSQRRD